jgi:hypothetical protein
MATQLIEATGDVAAVKVKAGSRLRFSFDIRIDATAFDREGDALIITLKDGRKVVLEDFFVVAADGGELPVFVLYDGTEVASADFLLSMNPDLDVTASGKTSGGIEEYAADTDALAEWTDVLGKAETDTWSSGVSAPDPILSPEYVSLAASYLGTTSDGWSSPPPTSGDATIIPPLPPNERPNDPSLPSDERPSDPQLPPPPVTPDGPAVPVLDERFVFSSVNAKAENFKHVLRNDGEGVTLTGVLDEYGHIVTLDELAALAGVGLETRTGKLFMKDGTLVFQPKAGVGADDTEIVTYVGKDVNDKAYARNVEIRFTDKAGGFSSDDAVDAYYVNTHNDYRSADLQFGAGNDAVILQADSIMAQGRSLNGNRSREGGIKNG